MIRDQHYVMHLFWRSRTRSGQPYRLICRFSRLTGKPRHQPVNFDEMGHLKYKAYGRGKSGNCRLEGHSTLFGINISLNCARDNFLFNGDAHFSLVSVSKFHGPRVKKKKTTYATETKITDCTGKKRVESLWNH